MSNAESCLQRAVPLLAMFASSPQSKIKPAEFRSSKVDENHARQKQAINLRVGFARRRD